MHGFLIPYIRGVILCCNSFLELHPVGELVVELIEAKNIKNTDLIGKADPFVQMFVRQTKDKIKRSKTKKNTLKPAWNETFTIEVIFNVSFLLYISIALGLFFESYHVA